ncbi:MAG: formate dehydrogenase subunit alpha [Planctomycetia bacterium]|nr:formate dehydrogenase subunit alpha [Planctomycetia bacterium]
MPEQIDLTIDGGKITAEEGTTILEAAMANGIYIPRLCYHPDLEPVAVCRVCLVEVEGRAGLTTSCNTPVEQGMVVRTDTPEVTRTRRAAVELVVVDHQGECLHCAMNMQCELQRVANYVGLDEERLARLRKPERELPLDTSNPFFERDPNKCILCGICVRTCRELQGVSAIDFISRGYDTVIGTFANMALPDTACESCGECVARCPVGALRPKGFQQPAREVKTVCAYCGCGCGLYLGVRGDRIVSARGDPDSLASRGSLCVKGRFAHGFVNSPKRLTAPLIRKNGKFVETTWDEALDLVASKLAEHKAEEFAAISSAKCSNEENYIVQKFARLVMGTNNVDHCARLCHAPSVAGLVQSFGSGAMTNSTSEIAKARCIFAIGTNTTSAHPIIALEVKRAVRDGAVLIVANPREIALCRHAHIFLRNWPGSDVALLMGMMRVIIDRGLADREFIDERCENFDAFKKSLKDFDLDFVEEITGVPRDKIIEAACAYATLSPAAILYAMGITQHTHGTDNVLAISNLALLTGNVGKPASGVNPLRGQNNVQGACDMGALPNVYPGYQKVADPEVKKKFEKAWGCTLDASPGLTHMEIFDAADEGKIKAIYLVGENPMISEADCTHVAEAIAKLDFFVVQDIFLTETAELADVVLSAATFAEKEGTVTNTERRVQRMRKVIEPVGNSKPDWWITCELAKRMGAKGFDFSGPEEVMKEIASLTPSYGGISFERLENAGLQWPCPTREHPGTPILHTRKFATKSGKGRFVPHVYKPSDELTDDEYPLVLTTERSLYHFHTGTMTRKVEGLNELRSHELVEMNPIDADALGIVDGEEIRVSSRRGEITAKACVTEVSPPGVVCMTFHFAESPTNVLTNPALDPVAKIPETKVCAVRIQKV